MAKLFYLHRVEDDSGISGTGRIAQGVIFDNGKVALTWLSDTPSTFMTALVMFVPFMVTKGKQRYCLNKIGNGLSTN